MVKQKVDGYSRKLNGNIYKVQSYNRHKRPLGKQIKYKKAGQFYVALDKYGNVRGSKVITQKISSVKP